MIKSFFQGNNQYAVNRIGNSFHHVFNFKSCLVPQFWDFKYEWIGDTVKPYLYIYFNNIRWADQYHTLHPINMHTVFFRFTIMSWCIVNS